MHLHKKEFMSRFISLIAGIRFKRKIMRHGGSFENIMRNKLRLTFTFMEQIKRPILTNNCQNNLLKFLNQTNHIQHFIRKAVRAFHQVQKI